MIESCYLHRLNLKNPGLDLASELPELFSNDGLMNEAFSNIFLTTLKEQREREPFNLDRSFWARFNTYFLSKFELTKEEADSGSMTNTCSKLRSMAIAGGKKLP